MLVTVVSNAMQVYFLTHSFYRLCYPSLSLDCGYPALSGTLSGKDGRSVEGLLPLLSSHLDNTNLCCSRHFGQEDTEGKRETFEALPIL